MFLKNRNISSKIKRSKVTDYAALSKVSIFNMDSDCKQKVFHVYLKNNLKFLLLINFSLYFVSTP